MASGVAGLGWYLRDNLWYQWAILDPPMVLLCFVLVIGSVIADSITIQISYHTKTTLGGTVLFLMAVLLPPVLALLVALFATLVVLVVHRRRRRANP